MKCTIDEIINSYIPTTEQETKDLEMFKEYNKTFPDILTRNNKIAHATASAWIVNEKRDKVLMIYHKIYDSWAWIGGHADGEDDLLGVALREAKEETGITNLKVLSKLPIAIELLTVFGHIKHGVFVSPHMHIDSCFLFEAPEEQTLRIKEDENSGVKWIDVKDVILSSSEKHMHPIYEKIMNKYLK